MAGLALTYMHMDDLEAGTEALLLKVRRALSLSRALYTPLSAPTSSPYLPLCSLKVRRQAPFHAPP